MLVNWSEFNTVDIFVRDSNNFSNTINSNNAAQLFMIIYEMGKYLGFKQFLTAHLIVTYGVYKVIACYDDDWV